MGNSRQNASASRSEPSIGRTVSQPDGTSVANMPHPFDTSLSNSSNGLRIPLGNHMLTAGNPVQSHSQSFLEESQASPNLASDHAADVNKPSRFNNAPQHTEVQFQAIATNMRSFSPHPSPSTIMDFSDMPGFTHVDVSILPVDREVDSYRMVRFLDEIQGFWYTGQGSRNMHHKTAMRAHLDDLEARVA